MVSDIGIAPNSEVFNTFGETLTNAQLLNQYGFVLDVNENDRFEWSVREVFDVVPGERVEQDVEVAILDASKDILGSLLSLPHFFDQSELVCHDCDEGGDLYLNDEGKISADLWALLAAFVWRSGHRITDNSAMRLTEIVDAQLHMESLSDQEVEGKVEESSPAIDVVLQIAEAAIRLCERRKRESGKPNSFDYNLSDWLEVGVRYFYNRSLLSAFQQSPQGHFRTRLAISVLLTERSILDACQAGWSALLIDSRDSS